MVADPADLGLAVLGGPGSRVLPGGRPRPGICQPADDDSAASIPSASPQFRASSLASAFTSSQVISGPAQTAAISQIVKVMTGSTPASSAVPSTLLLSPLLDDLVNQDETHQPRPGLTRTIVKVVVFTIASVLVTSIVISSLLDINSHTATGYARNSRTPRGCNRVTR